MTVQNADRKSAVLRMALAASLIVLGALLWCAQHPASASAKSDINTFRVTPSTTEAGASPRRVHLRARGEPPHRGKAAVRLRRPEGHHDPYSRRCDRQPERGADLLGRRADPARMRNRHSGGGRGARNRNLPTHPDADSSHGRAGRPGGPVRIRRPHTRKSDLYLDHRADRQRLRVGLHDSGHFARPAS